MKNRHHIPIVVWLVIWAASAGSGCLSHRDEPPEIDNLVYSTGQAPVEKAGGMESVTGTISIMNENREVATVTTIAYDTGDRQVAEATLPVSADAVRATGSLAFWVEISTSKKENYTFQIYVTDVKGRRSNRIAGTFAVTDLF
jgi:hypothetical protein